MSLGWPLIGFIIAFQWSAGMMLIYHLFIYYPWFIKKSLPPVRFRQIPLMASFIAIIGLILRFIVRDDPGTTRLHVDLAESPWSIWEPLWVSVYCLLLFLILFALYWWKDYKRRIRWMLNLLNLTGLFLVFVMSMVFCHPTQPAWHNLFTPIDFYLSMLFLGTTSILLYQTRNGSMASQKILAVLCISLSALFLALLPVQMTYLSAIDESAQYSLQVQLADYRLLFYLKICVLLVALLAGIWSRSQIRSATNRNRSLILPATLAMLASLSFVIINRLLFNLQAL